jgi:phosphoglycolate phosphatase
VAFGLRPDDADFNVLREEFFRNYEACMTERTFAFDGVQVLLDSLHRAGLPWGVVTNKASRFSEPLTRAIPLFSTARTVVSGDTTPHAKPHPEPLLEAARRMGVPADRCIYVGDDERDIVAGLAAGMGTVAATYGYLGAKADTREWGAHAAIDSPAQLLKLLQLP